MLPEIAGPTPFTDSSRVLLAVNTARGSPPNSSSNRFSVTGPIFGSAFRTRNAWRSVSSPVIDRRPQRGGQIFEQFRRPHRNLTARAGQQIGRGAMPHHAARRRTERIRRGLRQ